MPRNDRHPQQRKSGGRDERGDASGAFPRPVAALFPLGLLFVCPSADVAFLLTGHRSWPWVAFAAMALGWAATLVGTVPDAFARLEAPRGTRARTYGWAALGTTVAALALVGFSLLLRARGAAGEAPSIDAMVPAWLGGIVALVAAWICGDLAEPLPGTPQEEENAWCS